MGWVENHMAKIEQQTEVTKPIIIYDGDCAFCSSSIRTLQRIIKRAPLMRPYQFTKLEDYGLTLEQCETALQYVAIDGKISAGHEAYRQMLKGLGGGWKVLGMLMRTPGYYAIANTVYRWVAKNRHRMPGGTPTCSIENRPRVN